MITKRELFIGGGGVFTAISCLNGLKLLNPLEGVPILRMDCLNKNNNFYPVKVIEKAIKKQKNYTVFGRLDTPTSDIVEFSKIAFKTSNFCMTNGTGGPTLRCNINVLEITPISRLFKEMVKKEPQTFKYRTAGFGECEVLPNGVAVIKDFRFACIVAIPHTKKDALN